MFRKLCALLSACTTLATAAPPAPAPLPIDAFIAEPEFRNPKLSPSGSSIAVVYRRDFQDVVVLLDSTTMQPRQGPTLSNLRLLNYWWKGDDTLLLLLGELNGQAYFRAFNLTTQKTSELRQLNREATQIVNPLVSDPTHVLVARATSTGNDLRRYDLVHDKAEVIEKNPGWVHRWLTNRAGNAIAGLGQVEDEWFMLVRENPTADWRRVELGRGSQPGFRPWAVAADQHRLLGYDYATADTARVVARDPITGAEDVIFHSPEVDPSYNLVWGDDETHVRAIAYETDQPRFHYLVEADAQLAAAIDRSLPHTVNNIVSTSADESRLLIEATSDVVPELYFLLDRKAGRLQSLGGARPGLVLDRLARSRFFTFPARDGQKLSGRILLPESPSGKPGLIVSAGYDLTQRVEATYQPFMQLWASRGYAVLEVNHRGVEGLGQAFAKAGEMKVATTMADDLADAARHAIAQGWVDARRVAIVGQGSGGVLALHTLVRHQDLFGAWIDLATPMDNSALDVDDLAFGLHDTRRRAQDYFRLKRYQRELDPSLQLGKVRVPSFHYFPRNLRARSAASVEKAMKKSGVECVVLVTPPPPNREDPTVANLDRRTHEETHRVYSAMLDFLQRALPSSPPESRPEVGASSASPAAPSGAP